jgi:hypothetical protein
MTEELVMSYKTSRPVKKAVTVRVSEAQVRSLMRARRIGTQSGLINALLAEEAERLTSERALKETAGAAKKSDFNDRIL